jgi:hypothetical protein
MPPKEDDVLRLKNLLSAGYSITDAAKIMNVSRSTAQRIKKKIQETSDSQGDLNLRWGVLGKNAVTLRVSNATMSQMLDWSKFIYWNNDDIFQNQEDFWVTYPLGKRLQEFHVVPQKLVKFFIAKHIDNLLTMSEIGVNHGYSSVSNQMNAWLINWFHHPKDWVEAVYQDCQWQGDLSEFHLTDIEKLDQEFIIDGIMQLCESDEVFGAFIHSTITAMFKNDEYVTEFVKSYEQPITDYVDFWIEMCEEGYELPKPDDYFKSDKVRDFFKSCYSPKNVLLAHSDLSEEIIDYMIEHENFNSQDVELVVFGGIDEIDLEFAKQGNFKNADEINWARDKKCTSQDEYNSVIQYGWESGDELRTAYQNYGVLPDNRQLFLNMDVMNIQVNWTGQWKTELLDWANMADQEDFRRLQGFPHPKAMKFFEDVLMQFDEPSVRTDYLMRDYNQIEVPGEFISNEESFSELLSKSCFKKIVKVGKGGVSTINLKSQTKEKEDWTPKPKISYSGFSHLQKSRKKAAKELQIHLADNNLKSSLTGSYDWLASNLRAKIGSGKKDEVHVIDELKSILNLNQESVNGLHQARMARNWIAHPFEADEVEPTWEMVELCLKTSENLLDHKN